MIESTHHISKQSENRLRLSSRRVCIFRIFQIQWDVGRCLFMKVVFTYELNYTGMVLFQSIGVGVICIEEILMKKNT